MARFLRLFPPELRVVVLCMCILLDALSSCLSLLPRSSAPCCPSSTSNRSMKPSNMSMHGETTTRVLSYHVLPCPALPCPALCSSMSHQAVRLALCGVSAPCCRLFVVDSLLLRLLHVSSEKPLALYVFSNNAAVSDHVLNSTSSGSAVANDCLMQACVGTLPFGEGDNTTQQHKAQQHMQTHQAQHRAHTCGDTRLMSSDLSACVLQLHLR